MAVLSTIIEFKTNQPSEFYTIFFLLYKRKFSVITESILNIKNTSTDPWLVAFSLRKNVLALFSLDRDSSDIQSIHGIRFLNACLLMVSHKSMALFFDPYVNRTQMAEVGRIRANSTTWGFSNH